MRAAIYVRLSRETDETTSPERRRAACEASCEARGWEVVAAEEDIDVSGFSRGLDRPGLQRILTRLAELDVIVFFKIDRLAAAWWKSVWVSTPPITVISSAMTVMGPSAGLL
jgi:site-specific DNA recombinase